MNAYDCICRRSGASAPFEGSRLRHVTPQGGAPVTFCVERSGFGPSERMTQTFTVLGATVSPNQYAGAGRCTPVDARAMAANA